MLLNKNFDVIITVFAELLNRFHLKNYLNLKNQRPEVIRWNSYRTIAAAADTLRDSKSPTMGM